ncbi:MAG: TetR/AcrR family transcriptional regulator [Chloroflexi bacterium]|nr:TetR/AcrR family transcriptional regulator [Chloroflexota bacterium]
MLSESRRFSSAAAVLFTHYGYDKTTVEDIARKASVAKGTIYLHFKSKDDLFAALITRESERMVERWFAMLDADPEGVTIYGMFRYGWQALQDNPLLRAIYIQDRNILGDYVRKLAALPQFTQMVSISDEFIRGFQRLGLIRDDMDPDALLYVLAGFRYGLIAGDSLVPLSKTSVEAVGEVVSKLLAGGITPPGNPSGTEEGRRILRDILDRGLEFMRQSRGPIEGDSNQGVGKT